MCQMSSELVEFCKMIETFWFTFYFDSILVALQNAGPENDADIAAGGGVNH